MDTTEFVREKRDEILALAARHKATVVRFVAPPGDHDVTAIGMKIVATFAGDPELPQYIEALLAFQNDLEVWLDVQVHVYDANGFKGSDGEEFLRQTVAV